jgi:hypothetical protein
MFILAGCTKTPENRKYLDEIKDMQIPTQFVIEKTQIISISTTDTLFTTKNNLQINQQAVVLKRLQYCAPIHHC